MIESRAVELEGTYEDEYERRMQFARQRAAQAWCEGDTCNIEMDVRLAEAFARILVVETDQPRLGCATTGELFCELADRVDMNYARLPSLRQYPHKAP